MNFQPRNLVLAGLALWIGLFVFLPVTHANCQAPEISLDTTRGERGTTLTVTGQAFASACNDVGGWGRLNPQQPAKKIKIFLKQGKKSTLLATVDKADSNLRFSVVVTIPAGTTPGKATLTAEAHSETTKPVVFEIIESARQ